MKKEISTMLRNLSFQQIFIFFAVIEQGSFTRAAEGLNMSQAAVSRVIANLEGETKLILFVRDVRGALPTPAGRTLYKEWKDASRSFGEGYIEAYKAQRGYIKKLNVGCIDMKQSFKHHITLIDCFEATYSGDRIKVEYTKAEALREGLVSKEYDMIFVNHFEAEYLEMLGAKCKLLVNKQCSVYIHWSHPFYDSKRLEAEDFSQQGITFFGSKDMIFSKQLLKFCGEYGVALDKIRFESDYKKALVSFIRETGFLFSEGIFEEGQVGNARCVPLEGINSGLAVAWMDDNMSVAVEQIARCVQALPHTN